ncbi:MAG: phosphate transport system regulator PhoU, partial [Burkholderiaceae bacterium]
IGDHAKNIAEFTIYIVKGADIRHAPLSKVESTVR